MLIQRVIAFLGDLVGDAGMALAERAARAVLARASRTLKPSSCSEPKASASAVAQSMPLAGVDHLALGVEHARDGAVRLEIRRAASSARRRLSLQRGPSARRSGRAGIRPRAVAKPDQRPSSQSALFGTVLLSGLELVVQERLEPRGFLFLDVPLRSSSPSSTRPGIRIKLHRRACCFLIALYMRGWVNIGSSPSLWPKRR